MNKEAIKKWVGNTELPFTPKGNMIVNPDSLTEIIHDGLTELSQDKWVSAKNINGIEDGQLCWVMFSPDRIKLCRLNDYRAYGGKGVYWQDMGSFDESIEGTMYIVISKPEF